MALCRQGWYRRALRLLDRNPLLDLRVSENLQCVRDLHPPATAPVVARDLAGLPDAPMLFCRCGRRQAASDGQLLCRWAGLSLCATYQARS
jgi:hypothetical protein